MSALKEIEEEIQTALENITGKLMRLYNDQKTRDFYIGHINDYLGQLKAKRDIYDYRVICDETNNTPEIVDANDFVSDIEVQYDISMGSIKKYRLSIDRRPADFKELLDQEEERRDG